jgi:hypothetical protein
VQEKLDLPTAGLVHRRRYLLRCQAVEKTDSVKLNGTEVEGGGAAISAEKSNELTGIGNAEVLLFDLA